MTHKRTYYVIAALGHKIDFVLTSREKANPCWVGEIRAANSKDFLNHKNESIFINDQGSFLEIYFRF